MRRTIYRFAAYCQLGLVLLTGCHPTQPFFIGETGDLQHYLDVATQIEHPDVHIASLPEATEAYQPFTLGNHEFEEWELSLEECIATALQNSKILRTTQGLNPTSGNSAAALLSSQGAQIGSVWGPGIVSATASTQPLAVDQNGNRTLPRGGVRANQVGGVEDALSEFDAQFSSFVSYNTTDRARNIGNSPFTPQQFRANDGTAQAALSKRTATGGVMTARTQGVYSYNNVSTGNAGLARNIPSDFTSSIEIQVQHPLLRNRGTLVNRIPVMLARINEDIALTDFEARVRNLVRDTEEAYWDLYAAYRSVEAARVGRDSSLDVWRVANDKFQESVDSPESEAQASAQYHSFEGQLQSAIAGSSVLGDPLGLYGRERRLRFIMGISPTDGRLIRPIDEPTLARVEFDWDMIKGEALVRSVELRQQKWSIKQTELELMSAKNQLLPDLNASALYRWLGVGDDFANDNRPNPVFPAPGSSSLNELFGGDYQEAGLRLELTPNPFGARRALASIRQSQLQLALNHEALREKELALEALLSDSYGLLQSNHAQIQTYLAQWKSAERAVKAWTDKFELSVGDNQQTILDNLLRNQETRARAQLNYYRALSEYNKSIAQVHYLKGSLLEYNNIALAEGPWAQKAYWDALERARERDASTVRNYGWTRPGVISQGPVQQNMSDAVGSGVEYLEPTPASMEGMNSILEEIPTPMPGNVPSAPSAPKPVVPGDKPPTAGISPQPIGSGIRVGQAPSNSSRSATIATSSATTNNVQQASFAAPAGRSGNLPAANATVPNNPFRSNQ